MKKVFLALLILLPLSSTLAGKTAEYPKRIDVAQHKDFHNVYKRLYEVANEEHFPEILKRLNQRELKSESGVLFTLPENNALILPFADGRQFCQLNVPALSKQRTIPEHEQVEVSQRLRDLCLVERDFLRFENNLKRRTGLQSIFSNGTLEDAPFDLVADLNDYDLFLFGHYHTIPHPSFPKDTGWEKGASELELGRYRTEKESQWMDERLAKIPPPGRMESVNDYPASKNLESDPSAMSHFHNLFPPLLDDLVPYSLATECTARQFFQPTFPYPNDFQVQPLVEGVTLPHPVALRVGGVRRNLWTAPREENYSIKNGLTHPNEFFKDSVLRLILLSHPGAQSRGGPLYERSKIYYHSLVESKDLEARLIMSGGGPVKVNLTLVPQKKLLNFQFIFPHLEGLVLESDSLNCSGCGGYEVEEGHTLGSFRLYGINVSKGQSMKVSFSMKAPGEPIIDTDEVREEDISRKFSGLLRFLLDEPDCILTLRSFGKATEGEDASDLLRAKDVCQQIRETRNRFKYREIEQDEKIDLLRKYDRRIWHDLDQWWEEVKGLDSLIEYIERQMLILSNRPRKY